MQKSPTVSWTLSGSQFDAIINRHVGFAMAREKSTITILTIQVGGTEIPFHVKHEGDFIHSFVVRLEDSGFIVQDGPPTNYKMTPLGIKVIGESISELTTLSTMSQNDETIAMKNQIPTKLLVQAIRDLHARTENNGDWPDGIPESFQQIRDLSVQVSNSDPTWVLTVECIVKNAAIKIIAEGTVCV